MEAKAFRRDRHSRQGEGRRVGVVVAAGVAALGMAGSATLLLRHRVAEGTKPESVASSASVDVAALQGRVNQLEQVLGAVAARGAVVASAGPSAEPTHAAALPPSVAMDPAPVLPSEDAVAREARRKQALEDLARNEPRDRSWAAAQEQAIRDSVQTSVGAGAGAAVESLSCHTSLCRLELSNDTVAAQQSFLSDFKRHLPPMTAAHFAVSGGKDGPAKTTVDFIRRGYPIPDPTAD